MEVKYTNLDVIDPDDREFIFNKKKFFIPGDIPVKIMCDTLKCSQAVMNKPTDTILIDKFVIALWGILKIRQPDLKKEFMEKSGFKKLVALFSYIYGEITPEETLANIEKAKKTFTEKKNST